jgi:transposase
MPMLEGAVDGVIGVDTHKHTLTAAAVDPVGAVLDQRTDRAEPAGYQRLLTFGRTRVPGRRVWALEGTGSYGAGWPASWPTTASRSSRSTAPPACPPQRRQERSAGRRPSRPPGAGPRAPGQPTRPRHPRGPAGAADLPPRRGHRPDRDHQPPQGAVVSAPAQLRSQLASVDGDELVGVCARLRGHPTPPMEHTATVRALRSTARRILALQAEVDEVGEQLGRLVAATMPALLEVIGIGPVVAAQLLVSWSHPGRLRAEAAFAALAGAAPIPASSGKTVRYRLNRSGDRQLNRALHTIALARRAHHPETRAYVARRTAQGKTSKEINRCLKRALARRLYKLLEATTHADRIKRLVTT